jgi:hypothetical protein
LPECFSYSYPILHPPPTMTAMCAVTFPEIAQFVPRAQLSRTTTDIFVHQKVH